jgi:hypothetical protein
MNCLGLIFSQQGHPKAQDLRLLCYTSKLPLTYVKALHYASKLPLT